jgi:hypothetical protein
VSRNKALTISFLRRLQNNPHLKTREKILKSMGCKKNMDSSHLGSCRSKEEGMGVRGERGEEREKEEGVERGRERIEADRDRREGGCSLLPIHSTSLVSHTVRL